MGGRILRQENVLARLENNFAWSATRGAMLSRCARQYYWSYYGSWGGWERWAERKCRQAYLLKKLSNRHSWAGHLVHDVICRVLGDVRAGRKYDAQALMLGAHEAMQSDWRHSKKGPRTKKGSRGFWGLLEHEYREPLPRAEWSALWRATKACLEAFFSSGLVDSFGKLSPDEWLELDTAASEGPPSWELDGVRIYAIPDVVVLEGGVPVVYDWKTGKPKPEDRRQVLGYALYLEHRYSIRPTAVVAKAVYLADGARQDVFSTSQESLNTHMARLRQEIATGRKLLADVERNTPLPIGAFKQTEYGAACRSCPFRRLCGRGAK